RACELRPNDMMLAYQLAVAARAARQAGHKVVITPPELAGDDGSSARQLSQYIAAEPEFIDAFLSLPESEIDLDLFNVLAGAISQSLTSHPNYADLHLYYARVMKRLGRLEHAVDHVKNALAINPNYVSALIELGRLQAATAEPVSAAASLELAISKGADWPDIHCLAGQTMLQSGQTEKGRRHLERALELRANYAPAKEALEGLAA
ncbi:MAG: tetratricopeptide repeat protein, partial [Planctomycetaceae bacterium]